MPTADIAEVKTVRFGVFSPSDIRAYSVVTIDAGGGEAIPGGKPITSSLVDPLMGPHDKNGDCGTCHGNMEACPGHYGCIEFEEPMYQVGFVEMVLDILRCVCFHCSSLLIDRTKDFMEDFVNAGRYKEAGCTKVLCRMKKKRPTCAYYSLTPNTDIETLNGCGKPLPKYSLGDPYTIIAEFQSSIPALGIERSFLLKASTAMEILKKISDEDVVLLGCDPRDNRPEWMIQVNMLVPPYCIRPSTGNSGGSKDDEDITYKLAKIVKHNTNLKRAKQKLLKKQTPDHMREVDVQAKILQYHFATYIDNELGGITQAVQRTGKPMKAFRQRLKGKSGRFRQNLSGKRGNGSGRTVISPDPNIRVNEIGIPYSIARSLLYSELATELNIDDLQKRIWRGPDALNGASMVVCPNGDKIDLKVGDHLSMILELGSEVHRHLKDGDYVVYNRQPSLHRISLMSHKARILPFSTFRLNLSATTPYNADLYPHV